MIDFDLEFPNMASEPEGVYSVNRELNLAWQIVEETGANLYLTGRAGTGKTTFLKILREKSQKRLVVLAPTGVAAINAVGTTIHSFFQLPFSPFLPGKGFLSEDKKFLNVSSKKKKLINSLSLIVIDEISMVRPDILDAIDMILRRIRHSSSPFGGVQLLLIGDLRQLPPVVRDAEWEQLKDYYPTPYFFESHALKQAGYQTVELSMVYRQSDKEFINILNSIRDGNADRETLKRLNLRCSNHTLVNDDGYIRLTTHNRRATVINENRLGSLTTQEYEFEADINGIFPESSYPAERFLKLKEGAQVMFIKNDIGIERRFYNGLIGKVISISEEKVRVEISESGEVIDVVRMEWENLQYLIDEASNKVVQQQVGTFRQFPLQLAWAITIHKSQGLTFDKAIIDATYSFAPGQTYVALSRCRSLEGMILESPIPVRAVIIDKNVNYFVEYCEKNSPDSESVEELKKKYIFNLFAEFFNYESIKMGYVDYQRLADEYLVPVYPDIEESLINQKQDIENAICSVANRFINSCGSKDLCEELSSLDSELRGRIRNGANYFQKQLKRLKEFLIFLPNDLENKTYNARLTNALDSLLYQINTKLIILAYIAAEGFTVTNYIDAKAKAAFDLEKAEGLKQLSKPSKRSKPAMQKKPKGYTVTETFNLFKDGKTIPEIAAARGLKETTITSHIELLIHRGKVNINEVINPRILKKLSLLFENNQGLSLSKMEVLVKSTFHPSEFPLYLLRMCINLYKRDAQFLSL